MRLAGSQRKREWGWGLEFVSDADQCLCFLFSEGTKEERKDRQAMRDEYINTEWLKKKSQGLWGAERYFPLPWALNIATFRGRLLLGVWLEGGVGALCHVSAGLVGACCMGHVKSKSHRERGRKTNEEAGLTSERRGCGRRRRGWTTAGGFIYTDTGTRQVPHDSRLTPSWAESHIESWLASALPYPAKGRQYWGLETRRGETRGKEPLWPSKVGEAATATATAATVTPPAPALLEREGTRLMERVLDRITRWATAAAAPGLLILLLPLLLKGREGEEGTREEEREEWKGVLGTVPLDSIDLSHQVLRHAPSRCDLARSIIRCISKEASERASTVWQSLTAYSLNPSPYAARRADHENCGHQTWPKGGQLATADGSVSFSSLFYLPPALGVSSLSRSNEPSQPLCKQHCPIFAILPRCFIYL